MVRRCRYGCVFFFFFSSRRRHTRFSRDWSSDVCSSDLAGANIAAEFHRSGYRAVAFNTAKYELTSLALPEAQRIHIGLDGGGARSDVEHGRECIAAHAERIRAAVAEHAAGADLVVVAAVLGGSIGSCVLELIALVREQEVPIVALTALPHHHETGIAKLNALCAVRDLAQNPPHGWVMIDNAKLGRLHKDVAINAYFDTVNREIVAPIDEFNRLNDRDSTVRILSCAHALPASIADLMAEAQREAGAIQQKAAQHFAALDLGGLEQLRPAPVPHAARPARRSSPPLAVPELSTAPEAAPPATTEPALRAVQSASQPSRGRYERLANAFKAAT